MRTRFHCALWAAALSLPSQPGDALPIATLALSGQAAPGTGASYAAFFRPVFSDAGALAYSAYLSTSDFGVWSRPAGEDSFALQMLADPELRPVGVSDAGAVAVAGGASSQGGFGAHQLWTPSPGGGHTLVARQGDPAPGVSGATFSWFDSESAVFTDAGETIFRAGIRQAGSFSTTSGIWAPDGAGGLALLIREGDPLPGVTGETVDFITTVTGSNEHGDLAQVLDFRGVWVAGPGTGFSPLAVAGESAPGSQSGAPFGHFSDADVTDSGVVGFSAGTTANESGVWVVEPGSGLEQRFAAGGTLPGGPDGVIVTGVAELELNDAGDLALHTFLSGTGVTQANDEALLAPDGAGGFRLLAREGELVAGGAGATFAEFSQIVMNEAGDVVVLATVDPPVGLGLRWMLLAAPAGGSLEVVVQEGATLEVAPGDVRSVYGFGDRDFTSLSGFTEIVPQSLSDSRQFAFAAYFLDGSTLSSGLFLVNVPEPSTALLTLAALLGLGVARRAGC